jgi:hypothetical protein
MKIFTDESLKEDRIGCAVITTERTIRERMTTHDHFEYRARGSYQSYLFHKEKEQTDTHDKTRKRIREQLMDQTKRID